MITCDYKQEEFALIQTLRESGMSATAVLIGIRNDFLKDNKDGQWSEWIEIFDRYIESLIEEEEKDFE
ncbi:hypothetical protein [Paenibacillus pini]|uniref:Uncharacterized protein n=1 Tax=Paenibacillus pini JCM 16418 TaxID=1236976 RepID=W7YU98_9BACL|nr:hypothetical protein [Paenibacillus pini]GAF10788.1 hypothetical protein JCM16418_5009 [Paenibacillus pini JCM 16418]